MVRDEDLNLFYAHNLLCGVRIFCLFFAHKNQVLVLRTLPSPCFTLYSHLYEARVVFIMGELWRSEEMQLVQLYVQIEAAHDTVDALGELGLIQFRDVCNMLSPLSSPHSSTLTSLPFSVTLSTRSSVPMRWSESFASLKSSSKLPIRCSNVRDRVS